MSIWWVIQNKFFLQVTLIGIGMLMFWSVYVSDRGVRTVFQTARVRAVVLFIVLPSILYAACLAGPILLRKARSHLAIVSVPFENSLFTMHRPANWELLKNPGPGVVLFHIPDAGTFMVIIKDSQGITVDLEQTAQAVAQSNATNFKTVAKELDSFSAWGSYSGYGLRVSMNVDGNETIVRIFCGQLLGSRLLIVNEISLAREGSELEAQFEVVRKTFEVKPAK